MLKSTGYTYGILSSVQFSGSREVLEKPVVLRENRERGKGKLTIWQEMKKLYGRVVF